LQKKISKQGDCLEFCSVSCFIIEKVRMHKHLKNKAQNRYSLVRLNCNTKTACCEKSFKTFKKRKEERALAAGRC